VASIRREVVIHAAAHEIWDALRDVGALHTRLVPGFVTGCSLDGDLRTVTFFNGLTAKELIITVDDVARRLVWSVVGGRLTHHNASAQIHEVGSEACGVEWIADVLPNELAPAVAGMIEQGLLAMKRHAERHSAA
jgi:hypothetical protein